jgi:Carbamoyl-phosphate synthase L chain, ATP binding domain
LGNTNAASRRFAYQGLAPLRSVALAIAESKPDLVIPGDDLAARHLHELHSERNAYSSDPALGDLIERSLGSPDSFAVIHARAAFMKLASEEGVRVPETKVVSSEQDAKNWIERVGFPALLKADGSSGGEGVKLVRSQQDALRAFRKLQSPPLLARAMKRAFVDQDRTLVLPSLLRQRPTVNAQAFVSGHEATSTVACWKGSVLASLHCEVLRKCHDAGHATVVRLIDNAEMKTAVEKMVRRMGLSGMCGFDFMLEAATGNAYLIEINGRATQMGHLTLGAGRDLPAALYAAVSGQPGRMNPPITDNDTIALFPHEWARDPQSEFLRTGYHDVPWDAPELVRACIRRSEKQSNWYSQDRVAQAAAALPAQAGSDGSSPATARIVAR